MHLIQAEINHENMKMTICAVNVCYNKMTIYDVVIK